MLCAKAQKFGTVTDFQGLHYNFGNGCSGNTLETPEQFIAMQASAKQLDDCIARFAVSTSSPKLYALTQASFTVSPPKVTYCFPSLYAVSDFLE